jgi:hypothetical protein
MKKEILITLICAGLILVTPLSGVAQENKVTDNLKDEPDIEGLVSQIRTVVDEVLQKYGHIPMVRTLSNDILIKLNVPDNFFYCILLFSITIPVLLIYWIISWFGFGFYLQKIILVLFLDIQRFCTNSKSFTTILPLKKTYDMTEINDITELVSDCSCLKL